MLDLYVQVLRIGGLIYVILVILLGRDVNRPGHCLSPDAGGPGPDLPYPPLGCLLPLQAVLSLSGVNLCL